MFRVILFKPKIELLNSNNNSFLCSKSLAIEHNVLFKSFFHSPLVISLMFLIKNSLSISEFKYKWENIPDISSCGKNLSKYNQKL